MPPASTLALDLIVESRRKCQLRGGVVMNCPHWMPRPQPLLWVSLATFHIRGSKPPCLLLLVVHYPRMVFQRIEWMDT